MLLGLILGMGVSVGMAALKEYTDHSVWLPEEIERLSMHTVLAIIPHIQSPGEQRKKTVKSIFIMLAIIGVLTTGLAIFHYLIMDLYIFYDGLLKFLNDRFYIHF